MIDKLLVYCKIKAIQNALTPSEESVFDSFCRAYSKRFFTPLHIVRQLDPEFVIQSVFDDNYEEVDVFDEIEGILEDIYKIESPGYEKQQKVDMDAFIKNMEQREKRRLRGEQDKDDKRKAMLRPAGPVKSSGSVDFSKLKDDK